MADRSVTASLPDSVFMTRLQPLKFPTQRDVVMAADEVLAMHPLRGVPKNELPQRVTNQIKLDYDVKLRNLKACRDRLAEELALLEVRRLASAFDRKKAQELRKSDLAMRASVEAFWNARADDYRSWYVSRYVAPEMRSMLLRLIEDAYAQKPDLPEWIRSLPELLDQIGQLEVKTRSQIQQLPERVNPMVPAALEELILASNPFPGYVMARPFCAY